MSDNSNMTVTESLIRANEALDLANKINLVCNGRDTITVYMALSIVIGKSAARAERPNFEGLTGLLIQHSYNVFREEMEGQGRG
ncbi:hypothetical protein PCC82_06705 [Agrobacterium deltaense]